MSDAVNAPSSDRNGEDDRLMAELRALGSRLDPVPADAVAAARSAIAWRTMESELAALIDETSDAGLAGARGADTPTLLGFESPHLVIEVEVRQSRTGRSVLGQLVPAQVAQVELRHRGGTVAVMADEAGRFAAGPLEPGPLSLRCTAGAQVVETDWFLA